MPIYEYYCRENHTIYQFFARTLAQGRLLPACPDNPAYRLEKVPSLFAVVGRQGDESDEGPGGPGDGRAGDGPSGGPEDPRAEAAMAAMEREFAHVDESDPKAMARMMRRMAELTGEKVDGEMEEVVRKMEEGTDLDALEESLGPDGPDDDGALGGPPGGPPAGAAGAREKRFRPRRRPAPPVRDPRLHDYPVA